MPESLAIRQRWLAQRSADETKLPNKITAQSAVHQRPKHIAPGKVWNLTDLPDGFGFALRRNGKGRICRDDVQSSDSFLSRVIRPDAPSPTL